MSGLPVMLNDILQRAISRDPELETVATLGDGEAPGPAVARLEADVVILGESRERGWSSADDVARARPGAQVAKLSRSGRVVAIWSRGEQCMTLEGVSPDYLLRVLKCLVVTEAGPV
jgi:hypothetical protein